MITDFVIAEPTQAPDIAAHVRPAQKWESLEGWKVDTVKISSLFSVLSGEAFDGTQVSQITYLAGSKRTGPVVLLIPDRVRDAFAAIDPEESSAIGRRWAQTDELKADNWANDDASRFVREIAGLAQRASRQKRSLLLWLAW